MEWTTALSALLTGKALDVYSTMSDEAAVDYTQLKRALLKLYDLTADEYKNMFRRSCPEVHENPGQFIVRLRGYLDKWITFVRY